MNSDVLFISVEELKRESYIDHNVNNDDIRVAIKLLQDMVVERVLGTCLANYISDLICSGEIKDPINEIYKKLIDDYIQPIIIYGVQAKLPLPLSYQTRNAGMVKAEGDTYQQSALSEMKYVRQEYNNDRDFYIKRAVDFIKCNCSCFSHICSCGCCTSIQQPGNLDLSIGINLTMRGTTDDPSLYRLSRKRRW